MSTMAADFKELQVLQASKVAKNGKLQACKAKVEACKAEIEVHKARIEAFEARIKVCMASVANG